MSTRRIALPDVRRVREGPASDLPALEHPDWADSFPWLIQGTTTGGTPERPFDFRLFGSTPVAGGVPAHWDALRVAAGTCRVVHAAQVHGAEVHFHAAAAGEPGLHIVDPCDGHATTEPDLLLAVTIADCVPAFLVDPRTRAIAIAHAGWRGAVAGVLERAVSVLTRRRFDGAPLGKERASRVEDLHLHLGPAICGSCYEVGPEVFRALDFPAPDLPAPLDLRAVLAERAMASGVRSKRITISEHCTRCTDSGLFSHRGGDAARQVGYLGIRP